MARARAVHRDLLCHSCSREWSGLVWLHDESFSASHNFGPGSCSRCSFTHGTTTECRFKVTCTCPTPHVEVLPVEGASGATAYAQCRASQRAVVYQMPDGRLENPMTNSFDDPGAVDCAARGGIRREFYSVRELTQLHRESRHSDTDDWSMRAQVIDWDDRTIRSGLAMTPARQRAFDKMQPVTRSRRDVLFDGGARYEEAKRRSGRE